MTDQLIEPTSAPPLFPRTPTFTGFARPVRIECDAYDLEVEGTLPPELEGGFYRAGPDPQYPPLAGDDIYINGDGVVTFFRFQAGHVDLRMRYVRTEKFLLERQARRALFGKYRNPYTDDPSVARADRTTANTSVLWHGGRLFALKEDGLPYELDPLTLETLGRFDFDGALRSRTFTAHPRIDPVTGELLFYGYAVRGDQVSDDVMIGAADARNALTREEWFLPPYQSMIHDWGITETHLLLHVMPITTDPDRLRAGGDRWRWDPSRRTHIIVVPRHGSVEERMIFDGPPRFSFHAMNAFREGDLLHMDLCVGEEAPFPDLNGVVPARERTLQYLTRWTCDLRKGGGEFTERRMWGDMSVDFPDVDQRLQGRPYRHGWMVARDLTRAINPETAKAPFFNTVAHIDHTTGDVETWYIGDDAAVQEPIFVARGHDVPEGDGWLLTVINRHPERLGEVLVFDAQRIAAGPVATVRVPLFLRPVFHSAWVPGAELLHR
jgi:isoeugenol monooxygenase